MWQRFNGRAKLSPIFSADTGFPTRLIAPSFKQIAVEDDKSEFFNVPKCVS